MTRDELIKELIDDGYLKTPRIIEAFKKIDRQDFVPEEYQADAYINAPLPIGFSQTISQPLTVAFMLELLEPKTGEKILDVGSGSGWTTALLSEIAGLAGRVWGVERIPELVDFGQKNLAKYKFKNAEIVLSGAEIGLPDKAPFDKILVSAAAEKIPEELKNQLKAGGRMVIPIQNKVTLLEKISGANFKIKEFSGFSFVPLIKD
jgi:protein-L-isoaspartate(D-aspartate) O-methyltransferase